jgi:putative transcriptional regulator
MTQEEFAATYRIPIGTLRDWEQRRKFPDAPARAYLLVIEGNPQGVAALLEASPLARATWLTSLRTPTP